MLGTCTLLVEGMERLSLKSIDASVIVSILVVLYFDMSVYMSTDRYGGRPSAGRTSMFLSSFIESGVSDN
jgi:UDP-galactopyranose mutase